MRVITLFRNLPRPGKRNLKTAIAIFICLLITELLGKTPSIVVITSAMICLADSPEGSLKSGFNRIIGTIIGATFAIIIATFAKDIEGILWYVISCIGLVAFIHLLNLVKLNDSITIGGVVYLVILLDYTVPDPMAYATRRAMETSLGIIVAVFVNYFFFRGKYDRRASGKSNSDKFKFKLKREYKHIFREWKGGTSTELFIYPPKTLFLEKNFDWRVSVSTIDYNETTFVSIPGYERHIVSLFGSIKYIRDKEDIRIKKYEQTVLDGTGEIKCYGIATDYKLIISKRNYDGEINKIFKDQSYNVITKSEDGNKYSSKTYYSLYDNVKMTLILHNDESFDVILNKGDLFILESIELLEDDNYEPTITFTHKEEKDNNILCIESCVAKKDINKRKRIDKEKASLIDSKKNIAIDRKVVDKKNIDDKEKINIDEDIESHNISVDKVNLPIEKKATDNKNKAKKKAKVSKKKK